MKEEAKKDYRVLPSYTDGTLEEWEAFNPYSMCSAYAKQSFIYKLSSFKRNIKRENRKR